MAETEFIRRREALRVAQQAQKDARHTISPVGGDLIHVEYASGIRMWETPSVAERALDRGLAKRVPVKKIQLKKINEEKGLTQTPAHVRGLIF